MNLIRALSRSLAYVAVVALAGSAMAAQKDRPDKGAKQEKKAHKHHQNSGHAALGEKLKKNGKHEVGKLGNHTVTADVNNGKVVGMAAEGMAVKRVKSKQKMASADGGVMVADLSSAFHLVQYIDYYYYGYCFDDGYDYSCYWYPEEDVDTSGEWDDYDPYY